MAEFTPITTQEELNSIIGERLKRERETIEKKYADYLTVKEKAEKYEELLKKDFEGQVKTLQEKLAATEEKLTKNDASVSELTARAEKAEAEVLKGRIAHEAGIPYELAGRLAGATEEELKKDAETMAKYVSGVRTVPPLSTIGASSPQDASQAALSGLLSGLTGEK